MERMLEAGDEGASWGLSGEPKSELCLVSMGRRANCFVRAGIEVLEKRVCWLGGAGEKKGLWSGGRDVKSVSLGDVMASRVVGALSVLATIASVNRRLAGKSPEFRQPRRTRIANPRQDDDSTAIATQRRIIPGRDVRVL
jgi:hypothetical protein